MRNTGSSEKSDFPSRLRATREKLGMSQRELARRVNTSATSISQFEQGTREPGVRVVMRVAFELDVSIDFLLGFQRRGDQTPARVVELANLAADLSEDDLEILLAVANALVQRRTVAGSASKAKKKKKKGKPATKKKKGKGKR